MRALMTMGLVAALAVSVMAQAPAPAVELKVGDMAPDFTLHASDGKNYKLSDFRGKKAVVVAWFPKAFTQGCTIECKSLAANGDKIRKYDVAYFMASVDPLEGEQGNAAFAKAQGADFPLLSDPDKSVATLLSASLSSGKSAPCALANATLPCSPSSGSTLAMK